MNSKDRKTFISKIREAHAEARKKYNLWSPRSFERGIEFGEMLAYEWVALHAGLDNLHDDLKELRKRDCVPKE